MTPYFRAAVRIIHEGCVPVWRKRFTYPVPPEVDSGDVRAVRSYLQRRIAQRFPPPIRIEIDRIERLPFREEC